MSLLVLFQGALVSPLQIQPGQGYAHGADSIVPTVHETAAIVADRVAGGDAVVGRGQQIRGGQAPGVTGPGRRGGIQ